MQSSWSGPHLEDFVNFVDLLANLSNALVPLINQCLIVSHIVVQLQDFLPFLLLLRQ